MTATVAFTKLGGFVFGERRGRSVLASAWVQWGTNPLGDKHRRSLPEPTAPTSDPQATAAQSATPG